MVKVLIVTSVASMIEQFNMNNISLLQNLGYEVHVASNFKEGNNLSLERLSSFKEELTTAGVKYYHIDFKRNVFFFNKNCVALNQLREVCLENSYKFIHSQSPVGGLIGRIVARQMNIKSIYTAHGFHFFKGAPLINWLLFLPVEFILSKITDVLVTISIEDYQLALRLMKPKSLYHINGVGIDSTTYTRTNFNVSVLRGNLGIPLDRKIILAVGEVNRNKNHRLIIKALTQLDDKVIFVICGKDKGPERIILDELLQHEKLQDRVKFLGFRSDVKDLYKIADVFVQPSYREGLSVALMEAMASGLPIVASDIRGNRELVDQGKGGILIDPRDYQMVAKSLDVILEDGVLHSLMSQYNLLKISKYNYVNVDNEMRKIYMTLN